MPYLTMLLYLWFPPPVTETDEPKPRSIPRGFPCVPVKQTTETMFEIKVNKYTKQIQTTFCNSDDVMCSMSHRIVNLWGKISSVSGLKSGANLFSILYNYLQNESKSTVFKHTNIDQLQFKGRSHRRI